MAEQVIENAGYISLENAMSQANYIPEHNPSKGRSMDFVLQKLIKINQKSENPGLLKLMSFIEIDKFDAKLIKIAIAILLDVSLGKRTKDIIDLAYFHEEEMDEDEKQTFVSILLCEIEAKKQSILADFDSLKQPAIVAKVENPLIVKTSRSSESLVDVEEDYKPSRKRKVQKQAKQVFILHKKGPELRRPRPRKSGISSKQKIMSVLEKHQSFLIYQEAFPLPKGIKRIKVKGDFDEIIVFIEEYVSQTHLPVQVIVEEDRAKVIFKKDLEKRQKKERYKTNIRIHAA